MTGTEPVVALAGNPNVGKSTLFNALTGLRQHTGNWPGKTVSTAQGRHTRRGVTYILVDLPGTYSLYARSEEEAVARNFLSTGQADAALIVCDATALERNLNLALQILELFPKSVVAVNLMDEARSKGIHVDVSALSSRLGVPVIPTAASRNEGVEPLMAAVAEMAESEGRNPYAVPYPPQVEEAVRALEPLVEALLPQTPPRWSALRLLEAVHPSLSPILAQALVREAEDIARQAVTFTQEKALQRDARLDRLLTSRRTGIPLMLCLLAVVFWLTVAGANVPSQLLSDGLFWLGDRLGAALLTFHPPAWLYGLLIDGCWRTLAWVVSVMLPPMAIFFPLFTLLEDLGYLPRVAFVLDHAFHKAKSCGKQALTMCMGLGCNAAGVVGCRIIDSPRERLIAILTNNFVPCNGRFPTLIALLTLFFAGAGSLGAALGLTAVILLGILLTFWLSRFLSATVLKGEPSAFTLELPPYRKPRVGQVIARSVVDRTLFVLGRAAAVAAPAGLVIWLFANVRVGDMSLLAHCTGFLDPLGRLMGMDGVLLMAFLLGFPANEIVLPLALMGYLATGTLVEVPDLVAFREILIANGWTTTTAACAMLFSLCHWPCSTTCLTIWKETKSLKWTLLAIALPTAVGFLGCTVLAAMF